MTGHHRGPKRSEEKASGWLQSAVTHIIVYCRSPASVTHVIFLQLLN